MALQNLHRARPSVRRRRTCRVAPRCGDQVARRPPQSGEQVWGPRRVVLRDASVLVPSCLLELLPRCYFRAAPDVREPHKCALVSKTPAFSDQAIHSIAVRAFGRRDTVPLGPLGEGLRQRCPATSRVRARAWDRLAIGRTTAVSEHSSLLSAPQGSDLAGIDLVMLDSPADAEDVTQTTFLNAYRALLRGERPRAAGKLVADDRLGHETGLARRKNKHKRSGTSARISLGEGMSLRRGLAPTSPR